MSSGFVSGGTTDQPIERDDEWLKAQREIDATRRRKEEESRQEGGKTLYEVLQNNKAAKQEAFEESIRLKNQFRNLDEDEVEFLDSVLESTRAKEQAVKKETSEQLEVFRRQQEEADKALLGEPRDTSATDSSTNGGQSVADESQWALSARKRKRAKDKEVLKGVKLRKSSSTSDGPASLSSNTSPAVPLNMVKGNAKDDSGHTEDSEIARKGNSNKPSEDANGGTEASALLGRASSSKVANVGFNVGALTGLGLGGYNSDEE